MPYLRTYTQPLCFVGNAPKNCYQAAGFTHFSPGQPGPITHHVVASAERLLLLLSKISHQQEALWRRTKGGRAEPAAQHSGPQTAEDNRNRPQPRRTRGPEWGYWTLNTLPSMKKGLKILCIHPKQVQYILSPPKKIPPLAANSADALLFRCSCQSVDLMWFEVVSLSLHS